MKKTTITLTAIILWMGAFGQEYYKFNSMTNQWDRYSEQVDEEWIDKIFQDSPLIFEGEITGDKQFIDTISKESENWLGNRYTLLSVNVNNVLKGDINKGAIGMLDPESKRLRGFDLKRGEIFEEEPEINYITPHPNLAKRGIYFCKVSEKMPSGNEYPLLLMGKENSIVAVKSYYFIDLNSLEFDIGRMIKIKFSSTDEVYEFLKKRENITTPKIVTPKEKGIKEEPVKKKGVDGSGARTKENEVKYAERVKNVQKYEQYLQMKVGKAANKTNGSCQEPFISEMIEGNAPNRALELFNPSNSPIDLSSFSIRLFQNGQLTPLIIPLSGTILPKSTFVIAHPAAKNEIKTKADMLDPQLTFDGNDAIVLEKTGGTQVDKIGEIGVNPGNSGWIVPPGGSTKEQTLRRKFPINKGETNWNQGKNQWTVHPKDSVSNLKQHQNACGTQAVEDVYYTFANPQETGVSPKYFEFDIMVEGTSNNTYLDNAAFFIQYNTLAFGSDVVANNKIILTKGTNFNTTTYVDPNTTVQDDVTDVFNFYIGSDFNAGSWNRTNVTISPQQLVHVKIEIANCNENTQLQVINQGQTSNVSFYTDNPTEDFFGNFFTYDNTNYTNDLLEILCEMKINSFTAPIYPGSWYSGSVDPGWELVVQGQNFGATRGSGNVYFIDANKPTATYPYTLLDDSDFISWSDNEIRIKVPSKINASGFTNKIPGSGIFYVKNNSGDSVLSNIQIDMPYGIKNSATFGGKRRIEFANAENDSTAIIFKLHTNITTYSDPMAELIVRRSVKEWSCNTLANFYVDTVATSANVVGDGISSIYFVSSFTSATTLASTNMLTTWCTTITGDTVIYPVEIDIKILLDPTTIGTGAWFIDTSGALPANRHDFYEVVLHEVGHANILKHVNDINSVMYWTTKFSTTASIPEVSRRWISTNDGDGGFEVVDKSVASALSPSCAAKSATYMGESCDGTSIVLGMNRPKQTIINFTVYPNPVGNNGFNVAYELDKNSTVNIRLFSHTGQFVRQYNEGTKTKGRYTKEIDTNDMSSGMYFIILNTNQGQSSSKIIKM